MALITFTHCNLAVALHHADLNILGSSLDNLEQTFNGQLDALISSHVIPVVLLQKFPYCFRRSADGIGLEQ